MEKLWKAGVVIPIHRAGCIQLWFKASILPFGREVVWNQLVPLPDGMSYMSTVAWIGNRIILLVWNHQRTENY